MTIKYLSLLTIYLITTVNINLISHQESYKNGFMNYENTEIITAKVPSNLGLPERRENGSTRLYHLG